MGWASGACLAEEVWSLFRKYIPEEKRTVVAKQLIEAFRDEDWDTVDEAETLATDAKWYDQAEYDAICIPTNSTIDDAENDLCEEGDPDVWPGGASRIQK